MFRIVAAWDGHWNAKQNQSIDKINSNHVVGKEVIVHGGIYTFLQFWDS